MLTINKLKEHIEFHYLQCALILLEWNVGSIKKIKDKSVSHNIFRIQSNDSIICGIFCIVFIEYMIAGKYMIVRIYQFIFS